MLLIAVVALLVFGPKRLPELAKTMGKGLAEFRRASSDLRRSIDLDMDPRSISAPKPETLPPAQAGAGDLSEEAATEDAATQETPETPATPATPATGDANPATGDAKTASEEPRGS